MNDKKLMIASDIHGSAFWCEKLIKAFEREKPLKLLLLGDILYHGARNDLPQGHSPKKVIEMLNGISDKIMCVRGNCDSEVDQMVLDFPIMQDLGLIYFENSTIYISHGHIYNKDNPPKIGFGDILINGHTHIPVFEKNQKFTFINCGSVALPKENSVHSYITIENGSVYFKNLENLQTVKTEKI